MNKNLRDKEVQDRAMLMDTKEWAQGVQIFILLIVYQKASTMEKAMNNKVEKMTPAVDISQASLSVTPELA